MNAATCRRFLRAACATVLVVLAGSAAAQQDKTAERNARRLQLQMQALQQQLQDLQAAKTKTDAEKAELAQRVQAQGEQLAAGEGARRKLGESLKTAEASRADLASTVADLQKKLAAQQRAADGALAAKDKSLAAAAQAEERERLQATTRGDEQSSQLADCSAKNQRLVVLGADLLDRYRRKGAIDALKQQEPFLGFRDVEMFNLVQDYRDKLDGERFDRGAVK